MKTKNSSYSSTKDYKSFTTIGDTIEVRRSRMVRKEKWKTINCEGVGLEAPDTFSNLLFFLRQSRVIIL